MNQNMEQLLRFGEGGNRLLTLAYAIKNRIVSERNTKLRERLNT